MKIKVKSLTAIYCWLQTTAYNDKAVIITFSAIIATLLLDTSLIKTYDLISSRESFQTNTLFIIIAIIGLIGQFIVLAFITSRVGYIRNNNQLHSATIHRFVLVTQYILSTFLIFVIVKIIWSSSYDNLIIMSTIVLSYGLTIFTMILLAQKFFYWFKSKKNWGVLFYGLSSATISINAILTIVYSILVLYNRPFETLPHSPNFSPAIIPYSTISIIYLSYSISVMTSFLLMWISTSLVLRDYSKKIGRFRYWIFVSIPLIFFISQYVALHLNLFTSLLQLDPMFYGILITLIFTLTIPTGAILFSITFWTIAKSLKSKSTVRNYLIISGFGIVMLFISNQATLLITAPYPPFGLITVSFLGLASYLVLIGIYSSAVSVAHEDELRKLIRKSAIRESKLLDSIGTAHMEQEIQQRVQGTVKKNQDILEQTTGIASSLTEDDIGSYIATVLAELKDAKAKKQ